MHRSALRITGRITGTLAVASLALLALLAAPPAPAADWPQFRGPNGQGCVDDAKLPLRWSETEGVAWKTPLPGRGWSSPVIAGDRVWLTTAEERVATDEEREELMRNSLGPKGQPVNAASSVKLSALEVDLATGAVLQQVPLFDVEGPPPIHGLNSFASPTPVIAEGRVVCHFGSMGTACIDAATGDVLWQRRFEIQHIVGPGSSPVVHEGRVILTCDGGDKQFLVAVDLATGEDAWRVDRPPIRTSDPDLRKAYCTPLVFTAAGRTQMVVPGAQWFVSYDPATGDEYWRVDHGAGYSNVPRPVFDGETVYLDTGFNKAQLWAVRVDGAGDVTDTHVVWRQTQQMPTMPSPVMHGDRIFIISDGGVASCLDAATGQIVWRERVPGQYSASPLLGAGVVYFSNHDGRTTVVAADDQFKIVAVNALDGRHMASPAVAEGDLVLRTDSHLYRITAE